VCFVQQIFPPELKRTSLKALQVVSADQKITWYRPTTALEATQLLERFGKTIRPIVGSTEITIERKFKNMVNANYMYLGNVAEMNVLEQHQDFVRIGGSVPLGAVLDFLRRLMRDESLPSYRTRPLAAVCEQLRWFGSTQIRNVACLAGNIATASPISYAPFAYFTAFNILTLAAPLLSVMLPRRFGLSARRF
jgi:xanthine dehydrogenase/oxidase